MSGIELGNNEAGKAVTLRIPKDEGFQFTILGGSGSGKTHSLHRLIEFIPKDRPIFIADIEQDFIPLRRHRDFVVIGKGRDMPADPHVAPMLAKKFLEAGFSIIFDAFEEPKKRRELFLKAFLETLHDAPRSLWRPATIVIDELDRWAPEKGETESECTEACAAAAQRFRKRGLDIVMATTRVSKVDKTTISMSRNWMIGLSNIDTDFKRSLSFLGFTEKEDKQRYRDLDRGDFFVWGPAVGIRRPEKIHVGPAKLFIPALSKRKGARAPAPPERVKKLIGELKDLPKEAEQELNDVKALQARVRELERQLKQRPEPKMDKEQIQKEAEKLTKIAVAGAVKEYKKVLDHMRAAINGAIADAIIQLGDKDLVPKTEWVSPVMTFTPSMPLKRMSNPKIVHSDPVPLKVEAEDTNGITPQARKILGFLHMKAGQAFGKVQVAAMTGYRPGSGGFNSAISQLKKAGLIVQHGSAIAIASDADVKSLIGEHTPHSIEDWINKLKPQESKIYQLLMSAPDRTFKKEQIAEHTGYSHGSGGFNSAISKLKTLGLAQQHHDGSIGIDQSILGD